MTPLIRYERLSEALGVRLWVKHDDMYPVAYGGNKARKIGYITERARREGNNALVSAGSANSNHARVVALTASRLGWRCKLVIHDEEDYAQPNLRLMKLAGAELIFTDLASVAEVMDEAMDTLRKEGARPFYIWGGGHLVEGSLAYYQAHKEIVDQLESSLDFIVSASGTGTTQAGLHTGAALKGDGNTRVVGISVARSRERGEAVVRDSVKELVAFLEHSPIDQSVYFYDDWTYGGYGTLSDDVWKQIGWAAETEGLVLDPVYTGKAFTGMVDLIHNGTIPQGSQVVFVHTGGLLNLVSTYPAGTV